MSEEKMNMKRNRCDKIGGKMQGQDQFGMTFHMKLSDGEDVVPTWMGAFCSMVLMFILLAYTLQKVEVMLSKKDVDILTALNDSYLDSDFSFNAANGLNFAIKWHSLYDKTERLDPSIGRLVFRYSQWGYDENGDYTEE